MKRIYLSEALKHHVNKKGRGINPGLFSFVKLEQDYLLLLIAWI